MTSNETPELPDAEATLLALVERMRGAVAFDAAFVGIYSGGAWVAERLAELIPGNHYLEDGPDYRHRAAAIIADWLKTRA